MPLEPSELYNPIRYILSLGGKYLRPNLVLMVADMYRAGSRTCKTLRTSVMDKYGKSFAMTQKACGNGNNWRFIKQ